MPADWHGPSFRARREALGLTRREFGEPLGVPQPDRQMETWELPADNPRAKRPSRAQRSVLEDEMARREREAALAE